MTTDGIGSVASGPQAALVAFAIRFRGIVLALSVALLGYGLFALGEAKYGVFPEFAPPQVTIQTEAPGLSPEHVEILVTQPIETSINGLAGVESLRSSSIQGLSVITVVFQPRSDIYRARQLVTERLAVVAARLPQGVQPPSMRTSRCNRNSLGCGLDPRFQLHTAQSGDYRNGRGIVGESVPEECRTGTSR